MELGWQSLAILPILAGAVIYMVRRFARKKTVSSPCGGCSSAGEQCDCPLLKEKEKLHQL